MAGKPPRKSIKSTSAKKATSKTASTVTPISEGVKHGEIQNRAAQLNASVPSKQTSIQASNKTTGPQVAEQKITEQKANGHKTDGHQAAEHQITRHEIAEQIRVRAYELFEQRGRHEGHDHEDWARAEAEILSKYQREKSA
jgi:Protein of unknown function (DUF2934)